MFLKVLVFLSFTFTSASAADARIVWRKTAVEVNGLDQAILSALAPVVWDTQQWQQVLSVRTETSDPIADMNLPAMAGHYDVTPDGIRFTPQFPFEPGVAYRATLRPERLPGGAGRPITSTHKIKPPDLTPTAEVKSIYPTASRLPENLLKFYIQFSAPMSGGHIYDFISLRDDAGKSVELPFLEIDEELWNPEMTRLTLFLDPGRIKRGVKPLEEIGPSFQAGKSYSLSISSNWLDAKGAKLKTGFEKKFTVTPPDRDPPDPSRWKVSVGKNVSLAFDEPLDHAIVQRTFSIIDSTGKPINGVSSLTNEERVWTFTSADLFNSGQFQIVIPTLIEDLAGNNIGKPFDVDLSQGERRMTNDYIRLPFRIE